MHNGRLRPVRIRPRCSRLHPSLSGFFGTSALLGHPSLAKYRGGQLDFELRNSHFRTSGLFLCLSKLLGCAVQRPLKAAYLVSQLRGFLAPFSHVSLSTHKPDPEIIDRGFALLEACFCHGGSLIGSHAGCTFRVKGSMHPRKLSLERRNALKS